jgi:hypothetical protein
MKMGRIDCGVSFGQSRCASSDVEVLWLKRIMQLPAAAMHIDSEDREVAIIPCDLAELIVISVRFAKRPLRSDPGSGQPYVAV